MTASAYIAPHLGGLTGGATNEHGAKPNKETTMYASAVDVVGMIKKGVYVIVIQRETGKAYTLNRNYNLLDRQLDLPLGWTPNYIELERDHSFFVTPDWARVGGKEFACLPGFDAYWLY